MAIIYSARPAALTMFPTSLNPSQYFQPSEESQFLLPVHFSLQRNTLEHLLGNFSAPQCSKISVCTQEDRNVDAFLLGEDFLAESEDCFCGLQRSEQMRCTLRAANEHIFGEEMIQVKIDAQEQQQEVKQEDQGCKEEQPECKQEEDSAAREQSCHDQTKNIPKNYIKAIFSFILDHPHIIEQITSKCSVSSERLSEWVCAQKLVKRYTIDRLKSLWSGECGQAMRVVSCYFLRKRAVGYIFGSKIEKKMAHIRHRYKLIVGIGNPLGFSSIK